MPIAPSTSPCVNRYIHDVHNLLFFIIIILLSLTFINKYFIDKNRNHQITLDFNKFISEEIFVYFLFFYHIVITILRVSFNECKEVTDPFYIQPDDANSLYINAGYWFQNIKFELGSNVISYLLYPLVSIFKLSFFNINILFSLIGITGILFVFLVTKKVIFNKNINLTFFLILYLLLPNIHYWTSYLTKDVLVFTFLAMYLFYIFSETENKNFKIILIFSFVLIFFIRPYVGVFLLLGHGLSYIIVKNNFKIFRFATIFKMLLFLILLVYLFNYLYPKLQFTNFFSFFDTLQYQLSKRFDATSAGNMIVNYDNYLLRIALYFFTPIQIPNSILDFKTIMTSLNNIALVIIFSTLVVHIVLNTKYFKKAFFMIFEGKKKQVQKIGLLIFFFSFWIILSNTTGNYGISMRQKETIMFIIFFYLIYINSNILFLKKNDKNV